MEKKDRKENFMIISTKKGTLKEGIEKIVDRFKSVGLDVTSSSPARLQCLYLVVRYHQDRRARRPANPWIDNVTRVSAPIKGKQPSHPPRQIPSSTAAAEDRRQGEDRYGRPLQHRERRAGPPSHRASRPAVRLSPRRRFTSPHLSYFPGPRDWRASLIR